MYRTNRNNAVCFESLENALAKSPETYRYINLIAFGFPCQDISGANPKGEGIKGKRSSIFFECMRIVGILKPDWLFIENVPRLLSINKGRDMAVVLQTLAKCGYGWAYRLLDSQYFGVAQRRKRVFIIGRFGGMCPPEILFEQKSGYGNDKKNRKIRQVGLCISTRNGQRHDPTAETYIASTIQATDYQKTQHGQYGNEGNLICQTIGVDKRGNSFFVWQNNYIAETDPERKGKVTGIPKGLDSRRGIIIGNAVTVQVAEWIGQRIIKYVSMINRKSKTITPTDFPYKSGMC